MITDSPSALNSSRGAVYAVAKQSSRSAQLTRTAPPNAFRADTCTAGVLPDASFRPEHVRSGLQHSGTMIQMQSYLDGVRNATFWVPNSVHARSFGRAWPKRAIAVPVGMIRIKDIVACTAMPVQAAWRICGARAQSALKTPGILAKYTYNS